LELRNAGFAGEINILAEETHLPYERPPLSKDVLVQGAVAGQPPVASAEELETGRIGLHLADRVAAVDPSNRSVNTVSGKSYSYSVLVVATGARARRLNVPGADLDGVVTLRDAPDAVQLRDRLLRANRVAIVGGGVLGLEVAAAARDLGVEAIVLEQASACMERMLPAAAVGPILNLHAERGVQILCEAQVARIEGENGPTAIVLSDGRRFECDLVVAAIGSIANDALVANAQGECAGGILVDAQCRTSLPDVFAIGDVAIDRATRIRLESWDNANRQAAIVAAVIVGQTIPDRSPPWFWTDQYDLNVQVLGVPSAGNALVERLGSSPRQSVQFYLRDRMVTGAVLFDSGRERRTVARLIGREVDSAQLASANIPLKQL